MNLIIRIPQRIEARDDFPALLALELSGGKNKNGMFIFGSEMQRRAYDLKLRELEGAKCKNI